MGYAFNELIPAAILHLNPRGLTAAEYARKLDEIKDSGRGSEFHPQAPLWAHYDNPKDGTSLRRLAEELQLERIKPDYRGAVERRDENGLSIFFPVYHESKGKHRVVIHEGNNLERICLSEEEVLSEAPIIGSYHRMNGGDDGIVIDVVNHREVPDNFEPGTTFQLYTLKIAVVTPIVREKHYASRREVLREFPQFDEEKEYDWEKEEGTFREIGNWFIWEKCSGKYFLSKKTLEKIPASSRSNNQKSNSYGYSDLVLTAQAIKHHAWKLFSERGNKHKEQLLRSIPRAQRAMERAIWDAQTSEYAKEEGMTTTEFLKFRLGI
jgi:hypothetical protein